MEDGDHQPEPAVILVFSGKRKSGKDYVTDNLQAELGAESCEIMRLSAPLKKQYAVEHNLDFSRLLDASEYKEKVRVDMIKWGEERRNKDPGFFCRLSSLNSPGANKPVWIISDARRKTDLKYFRETYPQATVTVRVTASLKTREERGFVFTTNVDDAASECDLDDMTFDIVIENDGDSATVDNAIRQITDLIKSKTESEKL